MHEFDLFLSVILVAVEVGGLQADEEAFKVLHPLRELEVDPTFETLLLHVSFTHIVVIQPATVYKWIWRSLFLRVQLIFLGFLSYVGLFTAFRATSILMRGIFDSDHVRHCTFEELTLVSYMHLGLKLQLRILDLEHLIDAAHQSISVVNELLLTDRFREGGIPWLREGTHHYPDTHGRFISVIPHVPQVERHRRSRLNICSITHTSCANRGETVLQGHD
jgi:hypothetical protein